MPEEIENYATLHFYFGALTFESLRNDVEKIY